MTGPEYTSCVDPADYVETSGDAAIVLYLNLWEATDYMLHRKLVCMGSLHTRTKPEEPLRLLRTTDHGSSCAIGRVVSFEPPSGKSFPDSIDNDFSFNIVLRPEGSLSDNPFTDNGWTLLTADQRLDRVRKGFQGEFLTMQPGTPKPREADDGDPHYEGYTSDMFFDPSRGASGTSVTVLGSRIVWFLDGTLASYPLAQAGAYDVPVLHCECEGTRIRDVFNVVDQMPGGGAGCKKHWYTSVFCFFLRLITLPFTLAFVAEAWAKARDGNYHDAMDGNGEMNIGDLVLVRGRWVFDAGHKGYNEFHAVRTIQKIPETDGGTPPTGAPPEEVERFYKLWCDLADQAPPDHAAGVPPLGMTPAQTETYDNQQKPENGFTIHPDIDGCASRRQPSIDAVDPREINRELGDAQLVVLGSNFAHGATVTLTGPALPVDDVVVQSSNRLVATARVRNDAPTGPRDLTVRNPDGAAAVARGAVVIIDRPVIH